ncbi:angiopoietin-2-like [Physella acuta]|uniref:angiopoietin-2-like n=1 Tax=Physella acuta TaxID=109671 RepID=UPI0027DB7F4A|nr:angiopoietin-2-like [Physella acuta]
MWRIVICLFIFIFIGNAFSLKFTMEGEMYMESDKVYCGQLVCVQDLESHVASLVNMSIYSISDNSGKVIIAHLSEQGLQKDKDSPYKAAGQMTQTTAKLTVSVEGTAGCGLGAFLCQLYFVDPHGRADVREVFVFPPSTADESSPDLKFSLQLEVPWSNKPVGFRNKGKSLETSCDKMSKDSSEIMSELGEKVDSLRRNQGTPQIHEIHIEALKNIEGNLLKQIENKFRTIEEIFEAKFKTMQDKFDESIKNLTDRFPQFGEETYGEHKKNGDTNKSLEAIQINLINMTNTLNNLNLRFQSYEENCSRQHDEILKATYMYSNYFKYMCEKGFSSSHPPLRAVSAYSRHKKILCDTDTDGGGWIIMVRRVKGDVNFTRNWEEYKWGFGSFDGDFWLGNELVAKITSEGNFELRADMRYKDKPYYAVYDSFKVESEADGYRLRIGNYRGDAGDALKDYQKDRVFSTFDKDRSTDKCPINQRGGWWYSNCHYAHPTGVWKAKAHSGLNWYHVAGLRDSVDEIEMKFRRK